MISTGNIFLEFDYTNWKGVKGHREVKVVRIYFGSTDYHKEQQWLMKAFDLAKNEERVFAMKDMSNVKDMRYDK